MTPETGHELRALLGKTMWTCRRAAEMATFQFGQRTLVKDYYGRASEIGELALHVQCAWRIVRADSVVVASADLHYPAASSQDEATPEGFDWDRDPNRRDSLLESLFHGANVVVREVYLGPAGMCRIEFNDQMSLEIFPDDSLTREHWRLFATQDNDRPLIVTRGRQAP